MAIDTAWFHRELNVRKKSLRDLAQFLGIDPSAVSRMLKGERKMSADEQDQIADFLGIGILDVAAHRRGELRGFEEDTQQAYYSPRGSAARDRTSSRSGRVDPTDPNFVHPAFGCMVGTMTIPDDLDLTAPMDVEWSEKLYNE